MKLPNNMNEAKAMVKDLCDQVVQKVTEICNAGTKKPSAKPEESKATKKEDDQSPPA